MLTIQPDAISMVRITSLQPGELFIVSGGGGDFVAVAVENEEQRYMSWLRLTGENRFLLDRLEGGSYRAHAANVLRLGLHWSDLQLRMDETRIKRIGVVPVVGCLLVAEVPSIVTKFWASDDRDEDDAFGVSLKNISREYVSHGGYCCDKGQLVLVPQGLPPAVVAEFSPPQKVTS
jgi:hypothetical protein